VPSALENELSYDDDTIKTAILAFLGTEGFDREETEGLKVILDKLTEEDHGLDLLLTIFNILIHPMLDGSISEKSREETPLLFESSIFVSGVVIGSYLSNLEGREYVRPV